MAIHGLGGSYANSFSNVTSAKTPSENQSVRDTAKIEGSPTNQSSSVVTLSKKALAAAVQEATVPSFKEVGMDARSKLDALKQKSAERTGSTVSSVNLNHVDYSSFSDQELAAMNLNSSKNFSKDEQIQAAAMLNERLRVSLETYRGVTEMGDRRGHAMTINALYSQMTPEVRSAMGWTPLMMEANNSMLSGDEKNLGKLPVSAILSNLQTTQSEGGLTFKLELWKEGDEYANGKFSKS